MEYECIELKVKTKSVHCFKIYIYERLTEIS